MSNKVMRPRPTLTRQQKHYRESSQSAKTLQQMLTLFKKMEPLFPESELAMECLILSHKLHTQGGSPDQVIYYGKRALQILIRNNDQNIPCIKRFWRMLIEANGVGATECMHNRNPSFYIACLCVTLGAASRELKRYDECLSYLNWADRNLTTLLELDKDSRCAGNCVLSMLHSTHTEFISAKVEMGRIEEVVVHAKRILEILEILEKTVEEGSVRIGYGNRIVADPYFVPGRFQEALPFYLKALEDYLKHVGDGSVQEQIVHVRKNLRTVYVQLGEYDKVREQDRLLQNV